MSAVVDLATRRKPEPAPLPEPAVIVPGDSIVRMRQLKVRVGMSPATIYRRILLDDFPAQIPLGGKSVGWRESDISAWIASRGQGGAA